MRFDIFMIWAREPRDPEAPWLVDAWDEFSIDDNGSGWDEAVAKAKAANAEVRIVKVRVDHEAIVNAFAEASVEGEILS